MDLTKHICNIYFLGIGGIGMSALARYFKANGYHVAGYDRTPSDLTEKMSREEGIAINYTDDADMIPQEFTDKSSTLVIYTPAVPKDNKQMVRLQELGFTLYKRAQVLGMLSKQGKALCVAGTHGKTTVSTMVAFLLHNSKVGCNAFLGGISMNFGTNLLINRNSPWIVIEADEFDRSFLHLHPEVAVITSMDADHLDIYQDKSNLNDAFEEFAMKVNPDGGKLFIKNGLELSKAKADGFYDVNVPTDNYAGNLRIEDNNYVFDYIGQQAIIKNLRMGVPGKVNVENAVAAITMALATGMTPDEITGALPCFKGVWRRFNTHVNTSCCMYIDDYAHHPAEIEATLLSVKEMWPDKRLIVVFQPHLYTRTRDFHEGFAESLDIADEVVLLPVYPARELPIEGVASEMIAEKMTSPVRVLTKDELLKYVENDYKDGILVTMGAGDIDRLVPQITTIIDK